MVTSPGTYTSNPAPPAAPPPPKKPSREGRLAQTSSPKMAASPDKSHPFSFSLLSPMTPTIPCGPFGHSDEDARPHGTTQRPARRRKHVTGYGFGGGWEGTLLSPLQKGQATEQLLPQPLWKLVSCWAHASLSLRRQPLPPASLPPSPPSPCCQTKCSGAQEQVPTQTAWSALAPVPGELPGVSGDGLLQCLARPTASSPLW